MRALVTKAGAGALEMLTFTYEGGADFRRVHDSSPFKGKGVVAEVPDAQARLAVKKGAEASDFYTVREINNDLKFIGKMAANYELGTKVACEQTKTGFKLVPDESGRINRAGELAEGDLVAVGPAISPKALMNLHGLVVSVSGDKVKIEPDEGDLDRVRRATGKKWAPKIIVPISVLEKVA